MTESFQSCKRLPDFNMNCDNCGFTFLSQHEFYLPLVGEEFPTFLNEQCWCSVGCCLAYAKARLPVAAFVALRASVSARLRRPVWEKLPAAQLQHNGGGITFGEYHALGDCHQPAELGETYHKV